MEEIKLTCKNIVASLGVSKNSGFAYNKTLFILPRQHKNQSWRVERALGKRNFNLTGTTCLKGGGYL